MGNKKLDLIKKPPTTLMPFLIITYKLMLPAKTKKQAPSRVPREPKNDI